MNNEPLPCRKFWSERVDRESGDIVYEAKEITINGASDSDLLNSSFIVFQGARAKEDCELFMQAVSRATPQPIDFGSALYMGNDGQRAMVIAKKVSENGNA